MKKYVIYVSQLVVVLLIATSCNDWLEVQPKTEIRSENLFESESGFKEALIGVYINMGHVKAYGAESTIRFMEIIAGQYKLEAASEFESRYYNALHNDYKSKNSVTIIDNIWARNYNSIANLNNLLINIDKDTHILTPPMRAMIKGEALGLRAFLHFDLLRGFGHGNLANTPANLTKPAIPYVTDYDKQLEEQLTVAEVLQKVHSDLREASELLKTYDKWGPDFVESPDDGLDKFHGKRKHRFNYWAVKATQARAFMWEGKYTEALSCAEEFIANSEIEWIQDGDINVPEIYKDLSFSDEHIFTLYIKNFYKETDLQYFLTEGIGYVYVPLARVEEIYEAGAAGNLGSSDYRYLNHFNKTKPKCELDKFIKIEDAKIESIPPLIRKAEMYYIAAECFNRNGNTADAVHRLNEVRRSRTITEDLLPALTKEQVAKEIEKEYRKEFYGEGQMFYFYKRLGYETIPYSDSPGNNETYVLPIPQNEIDFGGRKN